MTNPASIFTVMGCSAVAALIAGLGALPFIGGRTVSKYWIGAAAATASGLMLGAGYLLMSEGLTASPLSTLIGAAVGISFTWWSQYYSGGQRISEVESGKGAGEAAGYRTLLQHSLHSVSEGVAIGASMYLNFNLGVLMALSLAVHNIGEAMALTAILRRTGVTSGRCAGFAIISNSTQVLLAVLVFVASPRLGEFFPVVLGMAAGSLVFLVVTELLPDSYRTTPKSAVATLVSTTAGIVILLEDLLV